MVLSLGGHCTVISMVLSLGGALRCHIYGSFSRRALRCHIYGSLSRRALRCHIYGSFSWLGIALSSLWFFLSAGHCTVISMVLSLGGTLRCHICGSFSWRGIAVSSLMVLNSHLLPRQGNALSHLWFCKPFFVREGIAQLHDICVHGSIRLLCMQATAPSYLTEQGITDGSMVTIFRSVFTHLRKWMKCTFASKASALNHLHDE